MIFSRRRDFRIFAVAAFAVAAFVANAQQADVGFKMLDKPRSIDGVSFVDAEGRELGLDAIQGKTILLNVWATWCPPCRKEMPALDRLQKALGGKRFQVVALSVDARGLRDVKPFYENLGLKDLGIFIDDEGSAMQDLRIIGLPTTLLIDDQGRELGRKEGPAAWDGPDAMAFLRKYLPAD